MRYTASLDTTSKVITIIISILFAGIIISQLVLFSEQFKWTHLFTSVFLIIVYVVSYMYRPIHYKVQNGNIIVHRPFSDVTFPHNEIKKIQLIDAKRLRGTTRTFGVGGLFGYFGQFMNSDIGSMTWYATRRRTDVVLIELNDSKKIIVTPDNPKQFVEQLQMAA